MTRQDITESSLTVLQRPPSQRNLLGELLPERSESAARPPLAGIESSDPAAAQLGTRIGGAAGPGVPSIDAVEMPRTDDVEQVEADDLDDDVISDETLSSELLEDVMVSSEPVGSDGEQSAPRVDPRLIALAEMTSADPRHGTLRRTVIEAHLPLVHHLAQRFRGRGEPYDDLVQVGTIGLLHAVDRYNPSRGSFAAFAVPTIVGEIRRHFRDRGWALRIPRRVQDLGRRVSEARETLTHNLDRSPTVHELAAYLQVDADLVLEALETASAYITVPLPITADESDRMTKAFEDSALELVEQRETLRPLLARLPARQQRILELRFARGMSQSQIAAEIGVSQMHVSRLLAKSLAALRSELTEEL